MLFKHCFYIFNNVSFYPSLLSFPEIRKLQVPDLHEPPCAWRPSGTICIVFVSLLALDVVFIPYPVTRSVGAEKTALLIP